jgi:Na+-transporting methylmalonyl-CoA/oxaloacetate decarboxylase gamma subunit
MDRKLARRNIRTGLITSAIMLFIFGMTFVAAFVYLSS